MKADLPDRIFGFVALERRVHELRRSIDFYVKALGFRLLGDEDARRLNADALIALGNERIALHVVAGSDHTSGVFAGPDVGFQHMAIVTRNMQEAVSRLERMDFANFKPITRGGPQRLPPTSGGATAFKFRDPDNHPLELIEFAASRAPNRWRKCVGSGLTLGLDHAAISVSDVERSIAFYEALGLRVNARQVNVGVEQARLDGLDVAEVEVVGMTLLGDADVHLELLAYRRPAAVLRASSSACERSYADCLVWRGGMAPCEFSDPDGHRHRLTPVVA